MSRKTLLVSLAAALAAAALLSTLPGSPDPVNHDETWAARETAHLQTALLHAEPGSARAFKLKLKLDRLEAAAEGRPQAGFPDEFARMLVEMKIPSDRTTPEYEPGYQSRELAKALRHARPQEKSITWTSRGPGNVAGRARDLVVDPDDSSGMTWFIATVGGGVWKTDDGGATWRQLSDEIPNLAVSSLVMAPANHDLMYAGTGESFYNVDVMNGNGMLVSTDRGETWTQLAATVDDPRFNNISRILVSPTDPNLVLASATTGRYQANVNAETNIFRSTDGGLTWTAVHTIVGAGTRSDPRILQLISDPTDFSVQYATVSHQGILKSTDTGQTWSFINTGITDLTGRFEMAVSHLNNKYLYAASEGGAGHSELWVSQNGGDSWSETFESGVEPNWLGVQGWYDNAIVCHPTNTAIVYVGGPQLYEIDLGGIGSTSRTTTALGSYYEPHPDHHILKVVEPASGGWFLLGTNDGGVARTPTGSTGWVMTIDGMVTTQFYGIDKMPGASAYLGGMQDNSTWFSPENPDETTPWTQAFGGDGYETSWHFDDPQKMIGGYQYNGLVRSLDGGQTWSSATSGLTDTGSSMAPFVTKIATSRQRPETLFAVGSSGVWRSTDFGGSWVSSPISSLVWGPLTTFHDVRVSPVDPDVVWGGSRMDGNGQLVVSTDDGVTFTGTALYPDVLMGPISGLAVHPTEAGTAYALFSFAERPKILKTTDLGVTWTDISGFGTGTVSTNGFPDVAVYDLLVWPNDPNRIWVGTEIGLVESLDAGATWALASNGLPAVGIWYLMAEEDEIVLGTHGRGIWSHTDVALEAGLTYNPLFNSMVQPPGGDLELSFNLRSEYDSTQVWVNGAQVHTYGPNARRQHETYMNPVLATGLFTAHAVGFKDGVTYSSISRTVNGYAFIDPLIDYVNDLDLDVDADDFTRIGFVWAAPSGFTTGALHTDHPYLNSSSPTATLSKPILVTETSTLSYDQIVLVEPGDANAVFGDSNFWDYVVAEGTTDGLAWTPLAPGEDAQADPDWLTTYFTGTPPPGDALYRSKLISLNDTFNSGDVVLLRFRLFADGYVDGWGWAVDNINVAGTYVSAAGEVPGAVSLAQNYPNPFNPSTTISFNLRHDGPVKLNVYDARGLLVRTLVDEARIAGEHRAVWDGKDGEGRPAAAGVYMYRLVTGDEVVGRKMMLVK